jgi:hypothetical protein
VPEKDGGSHRQSLYSWPTSFNTPQDLQKLLGFDGLPYHSVTFPKTWNEETGAVQSVNNSARQTELIYNPVKEVSNTHVHVNPTAFVLHKKVTKKS